MTLFILVFLVSLPVALPVALMQQAWVERCRKRRAHTARCGRCGSRLGKEALGRADAWWSAHFQRLYEKHPGVRLRLAPRRVWAVCVACGQRHDYDEKTGEFVRLEEEGTPEDLG